MKLKSSEQAAIDREIDKRKKWLILNEPVCIFCGRPCKNGDLAHKIRRSWTSRLYTRFELQTMPKNTGLAHRDCHDIFDNDKELSKTLPKYNKILKDIKEIDNEYYNITFG